MEAQPPVKSQFTQEFKDCAQKHSVSDLIQRINALSEEEFSALNHSLTKEEALALSWHLWQAGTDGSLIEFGFVKIFQAPSIKQRFIDALTLINTWPDGKPPANP